MTEAVTTDRRIEHTEPERRQRTWSTISLPQLQPVVSAAGLELVDVELRSGVLLVTVDREGGVDLEALTDANRAVSAVLDELDPIPGGTPSRCRAPGWSARCARRPTSPRRWGRR